MKSHGKNTLKSLTALLLAASLLVSFPTGTAEAPMLTDATPVASSATDDHAAVKACDGDTGTYWQSVGATNEFIGLAFDGMRSIEKLVLTWGGGRPDATGIKVEASSDLYTWTQVTATVSRETVDDTHYVDTVTFPAAVQAKGIRAFAATAAGGKEFLQLWEMEAYGYEAEGGPVLTAYPIGDVDFSGDTDASDLTAFARQVGGIEALSATGFLMDNGKNFAFTDVDRSGDVSADDLTALARHVASIEALPADVYAFVGEYVGDHKASFWATTKAPTCTEEGSEHRLCLDCLEELEVRAVAPLGHTLVLDHYVAPTETKTGLTRGLHCSVCHAVITEQQIIPVQKPYTFENQTFVFLGSSVTLGSAANDHSFVDMLDEEEACTCIKLAVGGTTLVDGSDQSYVSRLKAAVASGDIPVCDRLIVQLSTNDAGGNKDLGTIGDSFDIKDFDTGTVCGAIEFIIAYAKQTWDCPVSFYTNTYYESTAYAAMVDALLAIAEKWEISVLDLYHDPEMNAVSKADYARFMSDSIHPTATGYHDWWLPKFKEFLLEQGQLEKDLLLFPAR